MLTVKPRGHRARFPLALSEALLHRYFVRELEFTQNSETINAIVYFQIGIQLVDKAACHCETRLIAIYLEM